jgi:hypothetical protein
MSDFLTKNYNPILSIASWPKRHSDVGCLVIASVVKGSSIHSKFAKNQFSINILKIKLIERSLERPMDRSGSIS